MATTTALNSSSEIGSGNLHINWALIREISDAFKSFRNMNDENLKSLLLRKKVEVEEHINSIISDMAWLTVQRPLSGEDKDSPSDVSRLIEDLNKLLSLFHTSEYDSKTMEEIGELLKSFEARQPQLDATLLSPLVGQSDPDAVVVSEENADEKKTDSIVGDEDGQTEDGSLVDEEIETCCIQSQQQGSCMQSGER